MKDVFFEALVDGMEKKAFNISMLTPLGLPLAGISRAKSVLGTLTGKNNTANPVQALGEKTVKGAIGLS